MEMHYNVGLDYTDTSAPYGTNIVIQRYPFMTQEVRAVTRDFYPVEFAALTDLWADVPSVSADNSQAEAAFALLLREV